MSTEHSRPRKGQYAFWGYDRYPYFLGGKIEAVKRSPHPATSNGAAYIALIEGYGHWFPCRVVVSKTEGEKILSTLSELRQRRSEREDEVAVFFKHLMKEELEQTPGGTRVLDHIVQKEKVD